MIRCFVIMTVGLPLLGSIMCFFCGLGYSVKILATNFSPTQADIDAIQNMEPQLERIMESQTATVYLQAKLDDLKDDYTNNDRMQYYVAVIQEWIVYKELFG